MEWQKIETAICDDGVRVLLVHEYGPSEKRLQMVTIGSWSHDFDQWEDSGGFRLNPTHWHPLPPPPSQD